MSIARRETFGFIAAHDCGVARDVAEHDRGEFTGRIGWLRV
jgi:hypothetical protein